MDIFNKLMAENYRRLGFPVEVRTVNRLGFNEPDMITTYPGWGAGFFVLDVDVHRSGLESFKRLKKMVKLPKTVTVKTQSGGYHLYYKYPDNVNIPSKVDLLPGIDILSEDARVSMPPSTGQKTGKKYQWVYSPMQTEMALPPDPLLQIIATNQQNHNNMTIQDHSKFKNTTEENTKNGGKGSVLDPVMHGPGKLLTPLDPVMHTTSRPSTGGPGQVVNGSGNGVKLTASQASMGGSIAGIYKQYPAAAYGLTAVGMGAVIYTMIKNKRK